jgi:phosphoesterase RecJ-like protein
MTVMLNTLELHFQGRYATQYLRQQDFKNTGADYKDTENLIDECQKISSVEAVALFVEQGDGRIKCSLRSRGGVDVRNIAQKFGGGGHIMASGTHLDGPLEAAMQQVYREFEACFKD